MNEIITLKSLVNTILFHYIQESKRAADGLLPKTKPASRSTNGFLHKNDRTGWHNDYKVPAVKQGLSF